ncbi:glucuronate isomerase [Marvinbryantia formatexigens DSM 14469]|uniref:Uronate isomerase n=1 Tax=Marvinbryantia formatexigens DSM 14469 TaxID=478749 RepID=C6L978_9FIRM|nr:glucuronate isomerase [Marvinbryantia formatexigens]EET62817.1 glucuronate isomerase [Marvinbryantia formatexigens DSM 14469]UWO23165.1 glucuronate isomerase [Marvinbryantia formatexigens DSM 14469]SDG02035.1 glucuronate isomerase [Marvinbryantia formatexigens]
MKPFMDKDFLLSTETAKKLYHNYAEVMPVLDYHCHLNPQEIAEDKHFENITEVWLGGDHYKWRQMRSNGVEEYYITGDAPAREKFQKWAETLEKLIGNPLYHWSHLELQRYFGYTGHLCADTAEEVWNLCNEKLAQPDMSARELIKRSGVTLVCTTDDPVDSLEWHEKIKADETFDVQVLPAWRPDKASGIEKPAFPDYVAKLSEVSGIPVKSFADLKKAIVNRMEYFNERGCSVSDHGLDYVMYAPASDEEIEEIFAKRLSGGTLSACEVAKYKTAFMIFAGREYHRLNWVMQLHYGVKRDNNSRMFGKIGPDTGFDCISNYTPADQLADFLNALASTDELPKTILYSLNPVDNAAIGTIIGCFQDSSAIGKIQQGSAWWFNDNKTGMMEQMTSLANLGMLSNFVGMLTDSRSFLSYPRHEYFRRILCELIGGWVENGEYPDDEKALEKIIKGISYNNAVRYFGFNL